MASISARPNGSRFVSFMDTDGTRRHVSLGRVNKRYAEAIKVRVEDLVAAKIHRHPPTDDTTRWVKALDDRLHAKLAAVGLVAARDTAAVAGLLTQYLAARAGDLKPSSVRRLGQTHATLTGFFGDDRPLRSITPDDALAWRRWLRERDFAEATVKSHCGNAKSLAAEAVRRGQADDNPFAGLRSGATPCRYTRYVTPDEIARVIAACPDAEWRLLFGLARYAGLRVPSESHLVTPDDVDLARRRMRVVSPKTERYDGHAERVVPIDPRLAPLLAERLAEASANGGTLVAISGQGAVRRRVAGIWAAADVEPWQRLWQTLRASCEQEWAMAHPQFAVSLWIGHSITVSGKHYANAVPDELYDRAAGGAIVRDAEGSTPHPTSPPDIAQRHAQRQPSARAVTPRQDAEAA